VVELKRELSGVGHDADKQRLRGDRIYRQSVIQENTARISHVAEAVTIHEILPSQKPVFENVVIDARDRIWKTGSRLLPCPVS